VLAAARNERAKIVVEPQRKSFKSRLHIMQAPSD
jgi:hypothetical protein